MRLKQKLSAALAVLLIMLHGFPAFAITADDLQEPAETVTIQDNGTPSEPSNNQNEPSDILPEQGASPTEKPASPSDAEDLQESERPETGDDLTEPYPPEENNTTVDTPAIQTPADAPPEAPIIDLEEQSDAPTFSIEPMEGGENPGLYGTLDYIPEDTTHITVLFSFSGVDFEPAVNGDDGKDRAWDLSSLSEEDGQPKLTQLCMGVNDLPLKAFQNGEVPSLYIKLEIKRDGEVSETEPVKLSHDEITSIPDTPPPFSAKIELIMGGYALKGVFTDFLPNAAQVRPMYSLDGELYEPVGVDEMSRDWDLSFLGSENPKEQARLQIQVCAYSRDEPMNSYLKHGLERFYIKLQITTEAGETYDTEAAVIDRGRPQPIPENTTVSAIFPASMRAVEDGETPPYAYGKYQITVREDATAEDVYALFPSTLPIEVRITNPDTGIPITTGIVECEVNWKELPQLNLTAGKAFTIRDAANELVVPAGTEVSTPLGTYVLPEAIGLNGSETRDEIRIVVNAIGSGEKPDISLTGNMNDDFADGFKPLSLVFRLKPSGATSIKAYSYVEGDEDWTEICELLTFRDVNANQSAEMYGYVDVLQPDKSPYAEYLKGEITGFLIGIIIEGGTFDGERVILPWPGEYNPPTRIPELDGSGGNEGNAGSGDGSGDSAEGGQRPDLPGDGAPPVTVPPPGTSNPPDGSGTPPSTPDPPESAVPSFPDGNTTTSPPTDWAENGESTVSPKPPDNPDTLLPTEEAGKDTPPMENQLPTKPKYPAEHPPMIDQGNTFVTDNKPDNKETAASTPTEPGADKAAEIPVWNEVKPQEQTQEQSDAQADTRQTSNAEKTGGLPVAAVLLLGGGITAVAVVGAGSAAGGVAGTSAMSKLLTALKNFFRRS